MELNVKRLHKKGWKVHEIESTAKILKKSDQTKKKSMKILEHTAYIIILITAIIGNLAASYALVPLAVLVNNTNYFLILGAIGLSLGIMFTTVSKHLDLKTHHHTAILIIVPITAFLTFLFTTTIANNISKAYNLTGYHNPTLTAIIYTLTFILPHIYHLGTKNKV